MANLSKLTLPVKDAITGKVTRQTFDVGGGSGGHTIQNQSGTAMAQRINLKFNNATVVDDATNDVTIVTPTGDPTNFVGTIEEWETLSQAEQDMYDSVDLTDDYTDVTDELEALTYKVNNKVLYFTEVPCSATTGNFATVSNANITTNHVVVSVEYANPSSITSDVTWTTTNGRVTLNGACTSATTCSIVLAEKGN